MKVLEEQITATDIDRNALRGGAAPEVSVFFQSLMKNQTCARCMPT